MKRTLNSVGAGLLMIVCALGAHAQSVQTDYDHSFNLGGLKSFSFSTTARKANDPLAGNPINDQRIHNAIESQLTQKGFLSRDAESDFSISYHVATRKGFDVQDNRSGVFNRMGGLNVSQVTEGTLVVVFTDNATGREVWRGYASGVLTPGDLDKDVNKSIKKLVEKFVKNQSGKK